MARGAWPRLALILIGPIGLCGAVWVASRTDAVPSVCQNVGVPAYFRPGQTWDRAVTGAPTTRYLVMNPATGPGAEPDPDYVAAVRAAQDAHVQVLGYVDTT